MVLIPLWREDCQPGCSPRSANITLLEACAEGSRVPDELAEAVLPCSSGCHNDWRCNHRKNLIPSRPHKRHVQASSAFILVLIPLKRSRQPQSQIHCSFNAERGMSISFASAWRVPSVFALALVPWSGEYGRQGLCRTGPPRWDRLSS